MQQWLTEDAVELQLADSFRPARYRGTFQARTSKVWFELDTLVCVSCVVATSELYQTI